MHLKAFQLLISLIIMLAGCQSQKSISTNTLNTKISQYFQSEYLSKPNNSESLTLAWVKTNNGGTPILKYAVWDNNTLEIIYKDSAIRGTVEWLSDSSLLVIDYPGIINEESQLYRYKINLKTKIKSTLHERSSF